MRVFREDVVGTAGGVDIPVQLAATINLGTSEASGEGVVSYNVIWCIVLQLSSTLQPSFVLSSPQLSLISLLVQSHPILIRDTKALKVLPNLIIYLKSNDDVGKR